MLIDRTDCEIFEEPTKLRRNHRGFGQGLLAFLVASTPPIFQPVHEVRLPGLGRCLHRVLTLTSRSRDWTEAECRVHHHRSDEHDDETCDTQRDDGGCDTTDDQTQTSDDTEYTDCGTRARPATTG